MNIHDRSSLLLVPSGYKDGKLYSQVPNSGDGDFTFTRGSNLAATRVGADGLIEKGRENLLTYSNDFSQWINAASFNITTSQTGYDGTTDASSIEVLAAGAYKRIRKSFTHSGVTTFSVYAKANTENFMYLYFDATSLADSRVWFDLSQSDAANVIQTESFNISASVEDAGNGWYRCSITGLTDGNNEAWIGVSNADNSFNADASDSIYIQDAQLEVGLAATDYIESGATTAKAGILENQPRLDYSGGASRASLLLEPSRTNLVQSSEALIHGSYGWTLGSTTTLTLNDAISPEGVKNAFRLDIPTGNNTTLVRCNVLESTQYTFSFYVKRGTATELKYSIFNFSNLGNIVATTSYFSQTNTSDFVRIVVNFTTPIGCTDVGCYLDRDSGANGSAWFYGIQLEEGNYPTSYIPTYGASATRSSETAAKTIPSLVDTNSCTMLVEVDLPQGREGSANFVQLNGNSTCGWKGNYTPSPIIQLNGSGTISDSSTFSLSTGVHKLLFKWYNGTAEIFIDGVKQSSTITDSAAPTAFNGVNYTGSGYRTFQKQLVIFPTALSDTDCELLTGTTYESFAAMAEALNYTVYE